MIIRRHPGESSVLAALGDALSVLADRLRALPQRKLVPRAAAAHALAQSLADAAAGIEARGGAATPAIRELPSVGIFALGDQIAVTASDLVTAAAGLPEDESVWHGGDRRALIDVLVEARARADALRAEL